MELKDQVCSLELAKKLKELGVKQESLFWWVATHFPNKLLGEFADEVSFEIRNDNEFDADQSPIKESFSAFTVAELGELLNRKVGGIAFNTAHQKWTAWLGTNKELLADTEADARAKVFVYLLENKPQESQSKECFCRYRNGIRYWCSVCGVNGCHLQKGE